MGKTQPFLPPAIRKPKRRSLSSASLLGVHWPYPSDADPWPPPPTAPPHGRMDYGGHFVESYAPRPDGDMGVFDAYGQHYHQDLLSAPMPMDDWQTPMIDGDSGEPNNGVETAATLYDSAEADRIPLSMQTKSPFRHCYFQINETRQQLKRCLHHYTRLRACGAYAAEAAELLLQSIQALAKSLAKRSLFLKTRNGDFLPESQLPQHEELESIRQLRPPKSIGRRRKMKKDGIRFCDACQYNIAAPCPPDSDGALTLCESCQEHGAILERAKELITSSLPMVQVIGDSFLAASASFVATNGHHQRQQERQQHHHHQRLGRAFNYRHEQQSIQRRWSVHGQFNLQASAIASLPSSSTLSSSSSLQQYALPLHHQQLPSLQEVLQQPDVHDDIDDNTNAYSYSVPGAIGVRPDTALCYWPHTPLIHAPPRSPPNTAIAHPPQTFHFNNSALFNSGLVGGIDASGSEQGHRLRQNQTISFLVPEYDE